MTLHLPQFIQDEVFNQYDDERDRIRAGIPSSMLRAQVSGLNKTEFKYTSMNKRRFFKRYVSLKF